MCIAQEKDEKLFFFKKQEGYATCSPSYGSYADA